MKMKVSIKKMSDDAEDSVLDELIEKCESAMVSPFKKKALDLSDVQKKANQVDEPEEDSEESSEEPNESSKEDGDLSPEDLEQLMEMYKQLKG